MTEGKVGVIECDGEEKVPSVQIEVAELFAVASVEASTPQMGEISGTLTS